MSVRITIHRGTDQIGGTVTEIAADNTHIFVDFGAELSSEKGKSTDEKMVEMLKKAVQSDKCDGILFTHYHGDHVGLLSRIPEIEKSTGKTVSKLRIGHTARQVLINIHNRLKNSPKENEEQKKMHRDLLAVLENNERWLNKENGEEFEVVDGKPFHIGDFKITPVSTDHSAFDSFMYIIEAEGRCIVHTGDFRTHGRRGDKFFEHLSECLNSIKPDVLLIEGTMLSRLNNAEQNKEETSELISEVQLEEKAKELIRQNNRQVFVVCSSTNVDSLLSFHNAAKESGLKFYVNSYVYEQLKTYNGALENMGGEEPKFDLPGSDNENSEKEAAVCEINPFGISSEEIMQMKNNEFVMIINNPAGYLDFVKQFDTKEIKPLLIYSMWDGYLKKGKPYASESHIELAEMFNGRCCKLHTSGHACKEDIEQMINKVKPEKAIIPIHTERKWDFENLKINELSHLVTPMSDGDTYIVLSDVEYRETGEYQCIANETAKLLEERQWELKNGKLEQLQFPEWAGRYKGYYKKVKDNEKYTKAVCDCFDTGHAVKYLSLGRVNNTSISGNGKGNVFIDLRTAGVSVAELTVSPEELSDEMKKGAIEEEKIRKWATVKFKKRATDKVENNYLPKGREEEYRGITERLFDVRTGSEGKTEYSPKPIEWSNKAFEDYKNFNCEFELTAEHPVETKLLEALDRHDWSADLHLCKLCGQYYQLLTPIKASRIHESILKYSGPKGGGIDILANIKKKRICVIELKDSYDEKEPPANAIKQAIAYATFIIKLIRSEESNNKGWCSLFGIEPPLPHKPITVNAVIAMPFPKDCSVENIAKITEFAKEKSLTVATENDNGNIEQRWEDFIELHYMFFNEAALKNPKGEEGYIKTSLPIELSDNLCKEPK